MRFDPPIPVSAPRLWLPPTYETAEEVIALGRLDPETAERDGYLRLPVSDIAAPEMAVRAARLALAGAGVEPADVSFVNHAWTYYQGHDFWSPAHYIAARIGALASIPLGIQQMCNGGAAALEVAAARLGPQPRRDHAVVTTADRFCPPGFDRWTGDYGLAYGDAATALVLGGEAGDYALLSMWTVSAAELEVMHRGRDVFGSTPHGAGGAVDVRRTKKAFLTDGGGPRFTERAGQAVRDVIERAVKDAGLDPRDERLKYVVTPRLGRSVLDAAYLPAITAATSATVLTPGAETGHLGAGDAAANLAELDRDRRLAAGDHVLLLSAGGGFTWSCAVLRAERDRPGRAEEYTEPSTKE